MAIKRPDFLFELVRRRVLERYVGSTSVALWMVVSPLIPLVLNLLVFYFIARVPEVQAMGLGLYAAFAFSGLLVFRVLQRAASEGCDLLISNLDMLRSVNFPLPYLSLSSIGALLVDFALQIVLMGVLLAWSGQLPGGSLVLLPPAIAITVVLCIGMSWLASIAGYLAREMQELLTIGLTALLYLSPALYPLEAAPAALRPFIEFNPLTHLVIVFRDALLPSGGGLHVQSWLYAVALAAATFGAGLFAMSRLKRVVGDLV